MSYFYNQQGLNNSVQSSLGAGYLASGGTSFNAAGQPLWLTLGNFRQLTFGYRPADLRLTSLSVFNPESGLPEFLNLSYAYDQKGNVQSITDFMITGAPQTTTFTYDHRDRLVSVTGPQNSTFQYDTIGNMTQKQEGSTQGIAREMAAQCQNALDDDGDQRINDGCTTSYPTMCYSSQQFGCAGVAAGRPHAVKTAIASDGLHSISYDAAGNMTRETLNGAHLRVYEYDAEGRVSRAQHEPGAPFTYYHYDAGGELARKTTDPGQTGTVYVGGIYENTTGEVTKYYITAEGRRIAMRKGASLYYLANDHLDGTAVVMDVNGAFVSRTRYYPYGQGWTQEGTTPTDKLFTGHQREANPSGTYYAGARFYASDIGRFLSADTIVPTAADPQALNRYSYVYNSPTNYVDPTGHFGCLPCGGGMKPTLSWEQHNIFRALELVGLDPCPCDNWLDREYRERLDYIEKLARWQAEILFTAGLDLNLLPWSPFQRNILAGWANGLYGVKVEPTMSPYKPDPIETFAYWIKKAMPLAAAGGLVKWATGNAIQDSFLQTLANPAAGAWRLEGITIAPVTCSPKTVPL